MIYKKNAIAYRLVITLLYIECTDSRISDETWELAIGVQKILKAYATQLRFFHMFTNQMST